MLRVTKTHELWVVWESPGYVGHKCLFTPSRKSVLDQSNSDSKFSLTNQWGYWDCHEVWVRGFLKRLWKIHIQPYMKEPTQHRLLLQMTLIMPVSAPLTGSLASPCPQVGMQSKPLPQQFFYGVEPWESCKIWSSVNYGLFTSRGSGTSFQ